MAKRAKQTTTTRRYFLLAFQLENHNDPVASTLNRNVLADVLDQFDEVVTTDRASTEVDIWIDSPGGDAHAAYKLLLDLRDRAARVRAIIPDYAKSAATLVAIGCDEIFMASASELGPLDVQIEHPDREGMIISGLDFAKSLQFLQQFAIESVVQGGYRLVKTTQLPRRDVLAEVCRFNASFLEPMVAKLDPQLIHRAAQDLEVAKEYAVRVLRMRAIQSPPSPDDRFKTWEDWFSAKLVSNFPSHGFVISLREAKSMGLPVVHAASYDKWSQAKIAYKLWRLQSTTSLIKVLDEPGLLATFQEVQSDPQNDDGKENENHPTQSDAGAKPAPSTEAANGEGKTKVIRV